MRGERSRTGRIVAAPNMQADGIALADITGQLLITRIRRYLERKIRADGRSNV